MDAVQWLPRDNKEWLVARDRWKYTVMASTLSAATKVVAVVIADFYINRDPQHRHFNWAWAAQETLARAGGLSRRTVASAMDELERNKLIVVDRGGGQKGDRGRTHRYTLRTDHLNGDGALPADAVQKLHNLSRGEDVKGLHNSIDLHEVAACANGDVEMGNSRPKEVNGFPMTPSNITLGDSLYGEHPKEGGVARKRPTKERNKVFAPVQSFDSAITNQASSIDQADLAKYVGGGDVSAGWEILMRLPDGEVDMMARRYRNDKTTGPSILERIRSLLAAETELGVAP
jgi:Helix-turn-helix domain